VMARCVAGVLRVLALGVCSVGVTQGTVPGVQTGIKESLVPQIGAAAVRPYRSGAINSSPKNNPLSIPHWPRLTLRILKPSAPPRLAGDSAIAPSSPEPRPAPWDVTSLPLPAGVVSSIRASSTTVACRINQSTQHNYRGP
jgi:hypothetical protein